MGAAPPAEHRASLQIRNEKGLHARAAVLLMEALKSFAAEVTITKDGHVADGRSMLSVMMLAAEQGSTIEVTATGPQAGEALKAIRLLVEARFNEEK